MQPGTFEKSWQEIEQTPHGVCSHNFKKQVIIEPKLFDGYGPFRLLQTELIFKNGKVIGWGCGPADTDFAKQRRIDVTGW